MFTGMIHLWFVGEEAHLSSCYSHKTSHKTSTRKTLNQLIDLRKQIFQTKPIRKVKARHTETVPVYCVCQLLDDESNVWSGSHEVCSSASSSSYSLWVIQFFNGKRHSYKCETESGDQTIYVHISPPGGIIFSQRGLIMTIQNGPRGTIYVGNIWSGTNFGENNFLHDSTSKWEGQLKLEYTVVTLSPQRTKLKQSGH